MRLEIRQPSASTDSLKLLLAGRAELAVLDVHDLGLARERGVDLVGVGALVQRPLASVIAGPGVTRPRELEGKRVGVTGLPSDDAVLRAVVQGDGGRYQRVRRITIGFSAVPSLVAGKVAAATAFWSVEGVTLRARGVPTREFRVDDFGAPRYPELVLVTTRAELRGHRGEIRRASPPWPTARGRRCAARDRSWRPSRGRARRAGPGSPRARRDPARALPADPAGSQGPGRVGRVRRRSGSCAAHPTSDARSTPAWRRRRLRRLSSARPPRAPAEAARHAADEAWSSTPQHRRDPW